MTRPLAAARRPSSDELQFSDPACEWERRELLELGENIVEQMPAARPRFQPWLTAMERLSDDACRAFTPEAALTSLTAEFRKLWLSAASDSVDTHELKQANTTPIRMRPNFTYRGDDDSPPSELEHRCAAMPAASEWAADHIVFSSAQGALASVLYWAITQGFWDARQAPHLTFAGANLDTQALLDGFNRAGLTWGQPKSAAIVANDTARHSRVILIEPAFCDESANVMNIAAFHKTWRKTLAAEPTLIILDTTLTGPLFPIGELLESLEGTTAPVVVTLRSGTELDQAGLDMANVGIASIFRHKSNNETQAFAGRLRKVRASVGAELNDRDTRVLKAPWFLDSDYFRRYAGAVFDNNERLADDLGHGGRLFASVLHPKFARARCRWAQAPYTLLRLKEPSAENYKFLERVIAYEARRRGIFLERGPGFGHRGHRFQAVIPEKPRGAPFLRVAMGARSTPSLERTSRLLHELSKFRDFSQLAAQYESAVPRWSSPIAA
ncbi:MAG: hypothetical protein ABL996_02895 [Micropepsaceae bacterium]